jgi:TolA-binding protein
MKYYLALLLGLCFSSTSFSQSSLYQTGPQQSLDRQVVLLEKHSFSAAFYDAERLLAELLTPEQAQAAALNQAIASLQLGRPDGVGFMQAYLAEHTGHPSTAIAASLLGDHFFYKKKYAEAIAAYALIPIRMLRPELRAEILFKLGYSHFITKNYSQAALYLDQVKTLSFPIAGDALYYSGCIALEQGNTVQAINDLSGAEKTPFYATKVPYLLTGLYYQQGEYAKTIAYASPLLSAGQPLAQKELIHLYLAEAHYASKDFLKASQQYDAFLLLKQGELSREEVYKAGISFFEIKQYVRATDYLKVAASGVAADPIGQAASYYLGHAYLQVANYPFAATSFQAAAASAFHPALQEDALFNLAKLQLQRGNFQLGVNSLDSYLDTYPRGNNYSEAETLLSDALINSTDYLRAMDQMDQLRSKSSRIQQAYQKVAYFQAMIYYRDKKYEQALSLLTKSQRYPSSKELVAETYFWQGEIYSAQGDLANAKEAYAAALKGSTSTNPFALKAQYGLGYAHFNTQEYDKAAENFQAYLDGLGTTKSQYGEDALLRLGDCQYVQKKFDQAATIFLQAIKEGNAGSDYAYFQLAVVYNYQNKNEAAQEKLGQLIQSFPNSLYLEDALYQRGQVYLEELRYSEAVMAFSELITSKPNSPLLPFALEGRAVANFSQQRYVETVADYKLILDNHPTSTNAETALKGLQEALALQENSDEFGEYLQAYKKANPAAGTVQSLEYESAKNLYLAKKFSQAAKALENYLRGYPESGQKSEALYFAADSYLQVGEESKAIGLFSLLEQQPPSPYRVKALQQLGKIELAKGNFAEALRYLVPLGTQMRSQMEEVDLAQGIMAAQFGLGNYAEAIVAADQLIALGEVMPGMVSKAHLIKGKSQQALGQNLAAEDSYGFLVQEYVTEEAAEALLLLAQRYQEKGDFVGSNELIFDYSEGFAGFDYWYGSLFLLLADNYIQLDEEFQAKATLQSILDQSTNAAVKEKAAAVLKTLN